MKTLLLSAGSAAFVAVAFLAGATWAAATDERAGDPATREVTVYAGATALTLPASVLAAMPAPVRPVGAPHDERARLRLVSDAPAARD